MQSIFERVEASRQEGRGLPNEVYTSPAFFRWEREHVLGRGWLAVGFGADVARTGDIRRVDVLGMSLLVVRDEARQVRVFHNVCRHRGRALLDEPCSHAKMIRCPYHAWTYQLDGSLRGTPHIGGAGVHRVDGFDPSQYALFEVESRLWLDMVFINLDGAARPFEAVVAPLQARLEKLWGKDGQAALAPADDGFMEMEVRSNWKLALENYLEAYHLPIVHPGLNRYSPLASHYCYHDAKDFAGQGVTSYRPVLGAGTPMPPLQGWAKDREHTAEYPALYPNALLGVQRDHFFVMLLIPLSHDRTLERVALQYVGDAARDGDLIDTRQAILEGWRLVFQEDVAAVEGMQAGRDSNAFDGGVFTPILDAATRHFHRWYADQVATVHTACAGQQVEDAAQGAS